MQIGMNSFFHLVASFYLLLGQTGNLPLLDLTHPVKVPLSREEKEQGFIRQGWGLSPDPLKQNVVPLKISINREIQQPIRIGESAVFLARLTNISDSDIVLPWETDRHKVESGHKAPPPGYVNVYLHLTFENGKKRYHVPGFRLMGSQEAPGTLMRLGPNESAFIRIPVRFVRNNYLDREFIDNIDCPAKCIVKMSYSFLYGLREGFVWQTGSNALMVEVDREKEE